MRVRYVGSGPILLNATWTEYSYELESNLTKGQNFGKVDPDMILNVDDELGEKLLARGDFHKVRETKPEVEVPSEPEAKAQAKAEDKSDTTAEDKSKKVK